MNTSKCPLSLSQGHVQLKYPKPRHSLVYSPNPSMACEVLRSFIPVHPLTSLCSVLILTAYSAHTDFFRFLDCTLLSPAMSLLHTMFPLPGKFFPDSIFQWTPCLSFSSQPHLLPQGWLLWPGQRGWLVPLPRPQNTFFPSFSTLSTLIILLGL